MVEVALTWLNRHSTSIKFQEHQLSRLISTPVSTTSRSKVTGNKTRMTRGPSQRSRSSIKMHLIRPTRCLSKQETNGKHTSWLTSSIVKSLIAFWMISIWLSIVATTIPLSIPETWSTKVVFKHGIANKVLRAQAHSLCSNKHSLFTLLYLNLKYSFKAKIRLVMATGTSKNKFKITTSCSESLIVIFITLLEVTIDLLKNSLRRTLAITTRAIKMKVDLQTTTRIEVTSPKASSKSVTVVPCWLMTRTDQPLATSIHTLFLSWLLSLRHQCRNPMPTTMGWTRRRVAGGAMSNSRVKILTFSSART